MEHIVLDTNCLIISLPKRSKYHQVFTDFIRGKYMLCVTNEIIMEYEEILTQKVGSEIANNILNALLSSAHIRFVNPYYRFGLIQTDKDDNKFVDCALQANATYIVTQDKHYDVLKEMDFPRIDVIDIDRFLQLLNQ